VRNRYLCLNPCVIICQLSHFFIQVFIGHGTLIFSMWSYLWLDTLSVFSCWFLRDGNILDLIKQKTKNSYLYDLIKRDLDELFLVFECFDLLCVKNNNNLQLNLYFLALFFK